MRVLFLATWTAIAATNASARFVPPPAPGSSIHLTARQIKPAREWPDDAPLLGTYFFYWYDVDSKAHWINADGSDALVDHPANSDGYSYKSADWWARELRDVSAAGIDFIAPVYWGVPGQYDHGSFQWSFEGLAHLVTAWDRLHSAGENPPQVALFYDTSTLRHNGEDRHVDLTTDEGKEWFYTTIRDFFSLIPPRMWAMRDGGPIIFLYSAAFAKAQDPAVFPYLDGRFREDFATEPYVVREVSWQGQSDAVYAWGGALGLKPYSVAALGPGYDHHAVPGRKPLVVDRRGGDFYRENWRRFLQFSPERRARIVMVETWNELHEGTDIAETIEYGRQYIDMTAEFAEKFRAGVRLPISGPYRDAPEVSATLNHEREENGVALQIGGDGEMVPATWKDVECWQTAPNGAGPGRYAYFDVADSFAFDEDRLAVQIRVTYYDDGFDRFELQYDSADEAGSVREGAFKPGGSVEGRHSGEWRTATFDVTDGRFANRANGADFRLAVSGDRGELAISRVIVARR